MNDVYFNTLYHQETVVHNVLILWYLQEISHLRPADIYEQISTISETTVMRKKTI